MEDQDELCVACTKPHTEARPADLELRLVPVTVSSPARTRKSDGEPAYEAEIKGNVGIDGIDGGRPFNYSSKKYGLRWLAVIWCKGKI